MTRPQIEGDELEMLKELEEAEDVGSHKRMIEILIREAYDEHDTGSFVYDPLEERTTPISTDEMREICWRYDAPAINPDHRTSWPRSRSDKQDVLAAICRFEGIDSRGGVKSIIRQQIGKGDPITIEKVSGEHNEDKRRPRNYHYYVEPILQKLEEHPPEEADNLPDGFHGDVEPIHEVGGERVSAEEWIEKMRSKIGNNDTPVEALKQFVSNAEELIEENSEHPHVHLLEQGRDELEEEIENRRNADDDSDDDNEEEIVEEELSEGLEQLAEAEEADDEDGRENQSGDDHSEAEKARKVAEREGISVDESASGKNESQQATDDTDAQMVDLSASEDESDSQ